MKKLSREQYHTRWDQLLMKAKELSRAHSTLWNQFFSVNLTPCGFERSPKGKKYFNMPPGKWNKKIDTFSLSHFMDTQCGSLHRSCKRPTVVCIVETVEGYFETTHLVGECPFKE